MEKSFITENAIARTQLVSLVKQLTDDDLKRDAGEGWTVAVILAHLAFWELRTIVLLKRWKKTGVSSSPVDIEVLNEALLPLCKAIVPKTAAELAVTTAEEADKEIETLTDKLIMDIEALGDKRRLGRHIHRQMHIDQIQAILGSSKSA